MIFLKKCDLILDLDDVFVNFSEAICHEMNKVGDISDPSKYITYEFFKYHNLDNQSFRNIVNRSEIFSKVVPYDGAATAFNLLLKKGFRVHFCTARQGFTNAETLTKDYLDNLNLDYSSLTVMGETNKSKAHYYNQIKGGVGLFVDDAVHNILDAVEHGNKVIPVLMSRPWNEADERVLSLEREGKIIRVHSLLELAEKIELECPEETQSPFEKVTN